MNPKDFDDLYQLEERLWWFRGMRAITTSLLRGVELGRKGALDVGCGAGGMSSWFAEHLPDSPHFFLDVDSSAVRYAKQRGLRTLAQGSASSLPIDEAALSLVTSFDVLVQLPEGDDARAIEEAFRVLSPGGVLFVRSAALSWMRGAHDVAMHSYRRYSRGELQALVERAGFLVERISYANTVLFPLVFIKRVVLERGGRTGGASDVAELPWKWLDALFYGALLLEARVLRWCTLPIGLSVVCVARKPVSKKVAEQ
jgi:SAM-dependent methyltransferase